MKNINFDLKEKNLSWHELFKDISNKVSTKSSCIRYNVGALLVKENRIVSIGYNGVPKNKTHCKTYFIKKYKKSKSKKYLTFKDYLESQEFYEEHGKFSVDNEIHSETNCIGYCAQAGVSTKGCILYVTDSPCTSCAKLIIAAGIKAVYYNLKYDRDERGISLLNENKIKCEMIDFFK